jgi:hypothetical protein
MDFQNLNGTSTFPQLDIIVQLPTQSKTPLDDGNVYILESMATI